MTDRQHTIPQFYLRNFCPCYVYYLGKQEPRWITVPSNESLSKKYYGAMDELNNKVEDISAPIFNNLIESKQPLDSQSDKAILAYLFANLFLRNPNNIEKWREARLKLTKQLIEHLEITKASNNAVSQKLKQLNRDYEKLSAEGGHRFALADNFSALPDVADRIYKMYFYIFTAPAGLYFLTSDNPVILTGPWGKQDTLVQITLCPARVLIMSYRKLKAVTYINSATPQLVEDTNLDIISEAKQKIYSRELNKQAYKWMTEKG